jgi:hypothetical protein
VISCGAALHHLQVALAARGFAADVRRLPDPDDRGHLASVLAREEPGAPEAGLYSAIGERRTDRRRMSHVPVPPACLRSLADQAARAGALLVPVTDPAARGRLLPATPRRALSHVLR